MNGFPMCRDCATEYANPADRRFHAEPVACPACGPQLSANLSDVLAALESGRIVAIKGLGGFYSNGQHTRRNYEYHAPAFPD